MLFFIEKLNYFFRILFIGAVFLTVATVLWMCMRKRMKKTGHIRFLYGFLLVSGSSALLIFSVGVICLCLPQNLFQNNWTLFFFGWYMMSGMSTSIFHMVLFGIWFCGFLQSGYKLVKESNQNQDLYQWNQPVADPRILDRFYQVAEEIGTKKGALLFYNPAVSMPFLKGVRCPVVVIPFMEFSLEEQILIFAHELTHLKYSDIITRYLIRIIFLFYWFLPFEETWMNEVKELQESRCDIEVCRRYGAYFSAGGYYKMIVSIVERQGTLCKQGRDDWFSFLSGSGEQLEQRIDNMSWYQHGTHGKGGQVMAVMVSSLLLFLTSAACAVLPDAVVLQDIGVEQYGISDNIPRISWDHAFLRSQEKENCQIQWEVLTRYVLEPGVQIVSEPVQAIEGDQLSLLVMSGTKEYEVGLLSGDKKMTILHDREIAGVNLELTHMEYSLYICNNGEEELEIEMYCAQAKQ